ncbi:hypothetical protein N2152v2_008215 [Parachlorella kessleri]
MSETAAAPPQPSSLPEGAGAAGGVDGSDLSAQWASLMSAYAGAGQGKGQPALSAGQFVAGTMPLMPLGGFAQPFMYPAPLFYGGMPALHPAYTALAVGGEGADAKHAAGDGEQGSQDEHTDDEGGEAGSKDPDGKKSGSESKGTASALGKRKSAAGLGVKSQSSAALSLLASAAANKPGQGNAAAAGAVAAAAAAAAAAVAAQQTAAINDVWGTLNGQPPGVGPAPDLNRMASDAQMQQLLASGNLDEREAKRLRRKQSNRESARRSRLRKQAECEQLARQVKDLITENARLKEEKLQLGAQIEILTHKLSMTSALQLSFNQSELDKIQADLRAKQTQQAADMAAAMAQVNATLNGSASLANIKDEDDEQEQQDSEATSDGNQ